MAEADAGLELPIGLTEQKFAQQLARIEAKAIRASQKMQQGFIKSNEAITKSTSGMSSQVRGQVQNVSYQLQDIFVQIAGGQGVARALGQQLPQLLGGLGAVGAALGVVAAVAIPLAGRFLGVGDAAKDLKDNVEALEKAVRAYNSAQEDASASAADRMERFGSAMAQSQTLLDRISRLQFIEAVSAVDSTIESLSGNFSEIQGFLNVLDSELQQFGMISPGTSENVATYMLEQFGLTVEQARELNRLMTDAQSTANVAEKARLLDEMSRYMYDAVLATGETNEKARELAMSLAKASLESYDLAASAKTAAEETRRVAEAASTVASSVAAIDFSSAIAGASALVSALQGAVAAMGALEGKQAQAMQRAKIERDFAGDNVGKAGALGELDFNSTYDSANPYAGPLTKEMQADIDARREAYVEGERELAQIQADTQAKLKSIADAGRGGGGGRKRSGGGGGRTKREEPGLFENATRELESLQREISLIGKSTEEVAKAKAAWEMLDAAKKRGMTVNDTLNAQIDAQASQVGRLAAELEAAKIQQDQFDQTVDGIADAFAGALIAGESLRDGLAQVFKQIASDILNSGIRSALLGVFGGQGGGWGSLLGGLLGGGDPLTAALRGAGLPARAMGGMVTAGKAHWVGERGPEPFVPAVNGRVLSVAQAQAALRGGQSGGGAVDVRVSMDEGGNWQARVEQISGNVSARTVSAYDKSLPGRVMQISARPRLRN